MRKSLTAVLAVAVAVAVTVGCHDQSSPLAPPSGASARASAPEIALLDRADAKQKPLFPLRRVVPIADGASWSFVATPKGTVNRNPTAGLTIIVPAGAVTTNTNITVTTVGGSLVAYRLDPHGMHFGVPLLFVQDLRGTVNTKGPVTGAYFAGDAPQIDAKSHQLSVTEVEPTFGDDHTHSATMLVSHFSGYIFASGRSSDE